MSQTVGIRLRRAVDPDRGPGQSWRANELAAQLLWSTSRLAHHIGRMERRGLVRRNECADDGRGAAVSLTDAGWATLEAAAPPHVESVRRHLIDLLTPAELRALETISAKVIGHFTDLRRPKLDPPSVKSEDLAGKAVVRATCLC